jgi:ribonuclease D
MHAASQDVEILERACGSPPAHLFDTQIAAGFLGYGLPGLGTLLHRVLGVSLPKADRLTDWLRRPLPKAAMTYGAADVAHLLDLADALRADLDARERLAWVDEECELLRVRHGTPDDPDTAWWRIKDARNMRGKHAAVAQALAAWRERRAATVDRPVRTVLSDLAIVAIAQRVPSDASELGRLRGLDERHVRGKAADDLLHTVQAGLALDSSEVRFPPGDTVDRSLRAAVTLVSAWIGQLARELHIDPALLATRGDVESLLAGDEGARLLTGWRADLVGEPIRALIDGKAALAFDGRGNLVLERRSSSAWRSGEQRAGAGDGDDSDRD